MDVGARTIVVGVEGGEPGLTAVRYGATEARREQAELLLVHVAPHAVAMASMSPLVTGGSIRHVAESALSTGLHLATQVAGPDVRVRTDLPTGSRAHMLVRAGEGARAIVLGRRDHVSLSRFVTGSVCTHVATRSHCPVVSVPERWRPGGEPGPVVVGVDEPEVSAELLAAAFHAAVRRYAELRVVHLWHLPGPYDDLVIDDRSARAWQTEGVETVEKAMASLRAEHPDVPVRLDVRHEHPAPALMEAADGASLLMVGRRGHGSPFGFHLGGVARLLLTRAEVPVEVVPLHPRQQQVAEVGELTPG